MTFSIRLKSEENLFGDETSSIERFFIENNIIDPRLLEIARQERRITGDDFGMILVRNGFIRQEDLVNIILKADPEIIANEQVHIASIPSDVLIETSTMMVAETPDTLFAATLSPEPIVEAALAPYDTRRIVFVSCQPERLDAYLEYLHRLHSSDEDSLVDRMLRHALNHSVSDIHIIPRPNSYTVLGRRFGVRELMHEGALDEYYVLVARIKDRASLDLSERRIPQDGSFQVEHKRRMVDLRIAAVPTQHGEYVVIRLLDPDAVKPDLNGLGITRVDHWRRGTSRPDGLCLICGPTGSGKTTTLNATLRESDRIGKSTFSVEDPVEYSIPFVGQVNINTAVDLGFSRALRAFMRADPDVIVLGEVRDEETARNVVKAAETGHMVLATLHTRSIRGAIDRLRDIGVHAHELRYILRSVLVQRLLRVYCTHCHGKGCPRCMNSGYNGRTIVSECQYFHDEQDVQRLLDGERWWPTMVEDAVGKYRAGETSREEVLRIFGSEAEPLLDKE